MSDETAIGLGAESAVSTDAGMGATGTESTPVTPVQTAEPAAQPAEAAHEEPVVAGEDKDLEEFKPTVARQVVELVKDAPELKQLFTKYPKLEARITAAFRRDTAYRELGTVAELREYRNAFPNGAEDVKEIQEQANVAAQTDANYLTKDDLGNYPKHQEIVQTMREMNPAAFSALVKTGISELAKSDPAAYNAEFSRIMGATFQSERVFQHVANLQEMVKGSDDGGLKKAIDDLANWVNGFNPRTKQEHEATPEELRLKEERGRLDKDIAAQDKVKATEFHTRFMSESQKLQKQTIESHPLIQRLPANIPAHRRERIMTDIWNGMRQHLANTPVFMAKLNAAYSARDIAKATSIQKAAWTQPWLLNRYVRKVLAQETPGVVAASRQVAPTRTTPAAPAKPAAVGTEAGKRTAPYQVGKVWYKPTGVPFRTEEVLAGKHLRP